MRVTFWFRAVVLAACTVVVGAGAATAEPAAPTVQGAGTTTLQVDGHLQLIPGLEIFHVQTTAAQLAGEAPSGTFTGAGEVRSGPVDIPIPLSLAGPVTCLNVDGSTASFLYSVDSAQPQFLNDFVAHKTSVLFTVVKGANGEPNRIGFFGPLPTAFFHGCAPIGTPFVFNGTVTVNGAA